MRLDKTVHNAYNYNNQLADVENYKNLSWSKITEVFNYLQSVAYNFEINNYPKMDRTVHSCRKSG
jgi:hypothetical protein